MNLAGAILNFTWDIDEDVLKEMEDESERD